MFHVHRPTFAIFCHSNGCSFSGCETCALAYGGMLGSNLMWAAGRLVLGSCNHRTKPSHFTTYPSSNNQGSAKHGSFQLFRFIQKFRAIFHFHDYGRKGRYSTCVCPFHFSPWVLASSIVSGRVSALRNPPPGLCDPCPTHRGGGCGSIDACVRLQDSTWAFRDHDV